MFDKLTARGRVLLALAAAGSVIGGGMTGLAVSSSASTGDLSLNPSATSANLLDVSGYDTYVVSAAEQQNNNAGTWSVDVSGITGAIPTLQIVGPDASGDLLGSLTALGGAVQLPGFDPSVDQVSVKGADGAPSAATVTIFRDITGGTLTPDDHSAPAISLHWLDPSQLSLNLTAPNAITAGDPISSSLSLSPSLAPSVLKALSDNGAVNFDYFDNVNQPFGSSSTGELASGAFTGQSDSTCASVDTGYPCYGVPATGVYKTKATLLGDALGSAAPVQVANTSINDFNVGSVQLTAPTNADVAPLAAAKVSSAVKNAAPKNCGYCSFAAIRSGTSSVTYTAKALSNDQHPLPVANVPVEFQVWSAPGNVGTLTANGAPIPANGIVVVPADANGIAKLTVSDSSNTVNEPALYGDFYTVSAFANGVNADSPICALYERAVASDVATTPVVQSVKTGSTASISSTVLDQWGQAFGAPGYSVVYISTNGLFAKTNHPALSNVTPLNGLLDGRNSILGTSQVGADGKTTAPFQIHDFGDPKVDGMDSIQVLLFNVSDPNLDTFFGLVCVATNPAEIQWLQDPTPAFLGIGAENNLARTVGAPKLTLGKVNVGSGSDIPIDTSMGTIGWREELSEVWLSVHVTNNELPAQNLGGVPVTFSGPVGSSFEDASDPDTGNTPGQITALTDDNGVATVIATTTKTGLAAFKASVGGLSTSDTESFVNLPFDVRNIVTSPAKTLLSTQPQAVTSTALDIFGNPVPNVPVMMAESGIGRFAWGGHSAAGMTGPDGTISKDITTGTGEFGLAMVTTTVDDLSLPCFGSQDSDPAGFIYNTPVAGIAAGNSSITANINYLNPLTYSAPTFLPGPGVAMINGNGTPGSTVTLFGGAAQLGSAVVDPAGHFSFSPTISKSTYWDILSTDGQVSDVQLTTVAAQATAPSSGGTGAKIPTEKPSRPSVSSPRRGWLRISVSSNPKLSKDRVDFYLASSRGAVGRYLGSANTNTNGVAGLTATGLRPNALRYVIAYVHGVSGKVFGGWSPVSSVIRIHR